jgi:type VI secretion system protein ImpG
VRLRLTTTAGVTFDRLPLDVLPLYLGGRDDVAHRLYELCLAHTLGVLVLDAADTARAPERLRPGAVRAAGFADEQALLPVGPQSFQGYRLLQEYFAFPERYRFVELATLQPALARMATDCIDVVLLFDSGDPALESVVDAAAFAPFCTPAINLFPKRADRIHLADHAYEYQVVADRTRPLDFEIYDVTRVVGHGVGVEHEREFRRFYTAVADDDAAAHAPYYTVRREPRLVGAAEARRGSRSSYIGTEVFLAIVDPEEAPFSVDLRQLSLDVRCTNRDLPLQLATGGASDLVLDIAAPVASIRVVSGPSRPRAPLADGAVAWRAINHLSLNYLSLVDAAPGDGAAMLRDLLRLYAPDAHAPARKQVDGLRAVHVSRVVRRLPAAGPLAFGRGLQIAIDIDELAFAGASAYLLGAVLADFLARHVSINSFTETSLRTAHRGVIGRWLPRWGARPTL